MHISHSLCYFTSMSYMFSFILYIKAIYYSMTNLILVNETGNDDLI